MIFIPELISIKITNYLINKTKHQAFFCDTTKITNIVYPIRLLRQHYYFYT
ncbi:hypothetical protein SB6416_00024 [Klebsiella pasteurii]|uniref:Uncharacterized protein n=1 Tax=Klebsiella pasteurii TaxID=2587529 RepID=A0A9Q9SBZ4_9ENTR|nr:hypothetical protein SB6412_00010 [Klebsiella pasteurii]VUS55383.1 hypothetical protein SB6416_00024 [Klebsiella pasteurii]VUS94619.1 hypothetical protein SB6410_04249 [Klebsiella pasteurii]VUT01929.1 hypothetical protein SB6409_01801 [Klebsiella pasteurii]